MRSMSLVVCVSVVTVGGAYATVYGYTDIGAPSGWGAGYSIVPLSINDAGQAAGYGVPKDSLWSYAFFWSSGSFDLIHPDNWYRLYAYEVNAGGLVAGDGYGTATSGYEQVWLWSKAGGFRTLSRPTDWNDMYAVSLTDAGLVMGYGARSGDGIHGFTWDGTAFVDLGRFDNVSYITGFASTSLYTGTQTWSGGAAFRTWVKDGANTRLLDYPSGAYGLGINAMNSSGQVTGRCDVDPGEFRIRSELVVGTTTGGVQRKGTPTGWYSSQGVDIREDGLVLGYGDTTGSSDLRSFTWTPGGGFADLGLGPSWTDLVAHSINNQGVVAGHAYVGPETHGIIAAPSSTPAVPELPPGALAALVLIPYGLSVLGRRRAR